MAQISLYIDDSMAEKLNMAAKLRKCSLSKYVALILDEKISEEEAQESKKRKILKETRGAIKDDTFVEPPEIPWEYEIKRRYDLL